MKNLLNLRNKTIYFDKYLFISISLLSIMGLVFLYSASQANTVVVFKQSIFVLFGLLLMFFLSQPDPNFYKSWNICNINCAYPIHWQGSEWRKKMA